MRVTKRLCWLLCVASMILWGMPQKNGICMDQQVTNAVIAQAWKALSTSKWMRPYYGMDKVYVRHRQQSGYSNSVWRVEFGKKNYDGFGGGVCVYIDA